MFINMIILVMNIKPIIGIISRDSVTDTNKKIGIVYRDIYLAVIKSGGIPIGIYQDVDIRDYIDICNGFILQGGDDINNKNLDIIKTLMDKDIPLLGICLGMQEMFYNGDNMIDINNHKINNVHLVNVHRDTLLYKIVKRDKIVVNSRHKSCIGTTEHIVNAMSLDGIIEAIDIPNLRFFLGVQWHPENMYDIDINSREIFNYFVKICNG